MQVLIPAGGASSRWAGHRGVRHKHLLEVPSGERLIGRLIRQFGRHCDVTIIGTPDHAHPRAKLHAPEPPPVEVKMFEGNKFYDSRSLWAGGKPTLFVFGDVWFTNQAVERIFGQLLRNMVGVQAGHHAFGREGPSKITGKPYGEMFAFAVWGAAAAGGMLLELEMQAAEHAIGTLTRTAGWELYRGLTPGLYPEGAHAVNPKNFTEIDDLTEDFDYPADYERWLTAFRRAHSHAIPG